MNPLGSSQIFEIADRLGLRGALSPSEAILQYCDNRVRGFLDDCRDCTTPHELLDITAGMLKARFEQINADEDLRRITAQYCARGERAFANLANELGPTTYGVTFRLTQTAPHQPQFVCVIDSRGDKGLRTYFTKWHELGHLLILTDDERIKFHRNHRGGTAKDPEEVLVDKLAGHFGFYPLFLAPELRDPLSVAEINRIRAKLFPEASILASSSACVKLHPAPHLLIDAAISLSQTQMTRQRQASFDFLEPPAPKLRAVTVISNEPARATKLHIPRMYRVPEISVIYRIHTGDLDLTGVHEDLEWWESNSRRLPSRAVYVEARRSYAGVLALVRPA